MSEIDIALIDLAIREDLPHGDISSRWLEGGPVEISVVAREPGLLCGIGYLAVVYERLSLTIGAVPDVNVVCLCQDGDEIQPGTLLARLEGPLSTILAGERICLNFLMRLSGLATHARQIRNRFPAEVTVVDTRKTTPGWRRSEKYAFRVAGLTNHRLSLSESVMIKDNHLPFVRSGVKRGPLTPLEVEIDCCDQIAAVLPLEPDVLLLDNFTPAMVAEAARRVPDHIALEISGNVDGDKWDVLWANLDADSRARIKYVSIGRALQDGRWLDLGFDLAEK